MSGALLALWLLAAPPFEAPAAAGFERSSTRSWTVTQGAANHRGHDAVVGPDDPQWLIGKFAYGPLDKDLKEEWVDVFVGLPSEWRKVARLKTTREGNHEAVRGVADDGGRIYHALSPHLPVGVYPVRFHVEGDASAATQVLTVVAPGTEAVVFDIDGTLTASDREVFKELKALLEDRRYVPAVRPGATAVARQWASRGYLVVYVTARPDNLRAATRAWLASQGFPPGPVLLSNRVRDVIPGDAVREFKHDTLAQLTEKGLVRLVAGYGNAATDVAVYRDAGVPAERLYLVGETAAKGAQSVRFPTHLKALEALARAAHPAPAFPAWTALP